MDIELVTIGTELLLGFTIDTNAAELARVLATVGARVVRRTTVGDDPGDIDRAMRDALTRTRFVIATGGLGPTRDDMTKKVVAAIFEAPLELDSGYLEVLRQRFAAMGRVPMPESNRSQAEIPRGATVLPNNWGTAPGLWLEGPPGVAVLLPGVPNEMRKLVEHEVVPRIREKGKGKGETVVRSLTLRTTGIGESSLAAQIGEREDRIQPATLAYLPSVNGVDLRLTVSNLPAEAADTALKRAAAELLPGLRAHYYGDDTTDLAAIVFGLLRDGGHTLAVAESCTGGMLGERITAVPGASAVFRGGVIAYANEVKVASLGVSLALINEHGAVSEPVVRAMATGVSERFGVDTSIAVTGIAGPDGGTAEKPVGTVWLAARVQDREQVMKRRFLGERDEVRARSAQAGLDLLRHMLRQ
ncbi:MAG: competence/damage-inducible protein A [Gemmatimonadetes bacterium]|nr:competence/damage-inducible protein A [Gemmatimonadota bacterium]